MFFSRVPRSLLRRSAAGLLPRRFASTVPSKDRLAVMCILDGWGYRETAKDNAVVLAKTPNFDALYGHHSQRGQVAFLDACEGEVGLPVGQMGNSEVGHMNIGAGRIVYQDLCTIDNAIAEDTLKSQPALVSHIEKLRASGGTCHLLSLVSPGGVHAMQGHVAALANIVNAAGIPVVVHAFTDGRDVPPQDAKSTMPTFLESLDKGITVGSVTGRYYSMDRDNRWERVGTAFDVIVSGKGVASPTSTALEAVSQAYAADQTDEFVLPTVVGDYKGMQEGDGILMANFRADRARELLTAICDPNPPPELAAENESSGRAPQPKLADISGMVNYSKQHSTYMSAIFPEKDIQKPLGEVVADAGLTQLRTAETEKYPHVTFFFNGGREEPFEGEERILVPSPKVATYDLQPEMSAPEVGARLCEAIDSGRLNMVVVNFANPDMVGHTGKLDAAMAACEAVDTCLGNLVESVKKQKGSIIVTADHGNCEKMWEEATNEPHTAHTLNKVPCILADFSDDAVQGARTGVEYKIRSGRLADLAPTMLELLGVSQPEQMTGETLIIKQGTLGNLQDGPMLVRPPREGNPAAGTVP